LKSRVFLDSGIFIALLDRSDRWHAEARALFGSARGGWSTSLLVVSETHSWFLHRLGEEPARRFQTLLADLPDLEIYEATSAHHRLVLRMLDRLRGAKLTYVDASSLAFIAARRISTVWGTDRHLALTGARVLPID
jgi:predicted nucleic acid-binding protein